MQRRGAAIQMEVTICATILANKQTQGTPIYSHEWGISEGNLVPTAKAISGVKPEHSTRKRIEAIKGTQSQMRR
jgi:hypothetical protein